MTTIDVHCKDHSEYTQDCKRCRKAVSNARQRGKLPPAVKRDIPTTGPGALTAVDAEHMGLPAPAESEEARQTTCDADPVPETPAAPKAPRAKPRSRDMLPTRVLAARIPHAEFDALKKLAAHLGKSQIEVVLQGIQMVREQALLAEKAA